jgi:hypothetical protein
MFEFSDVSDSPWHVVDADDKYCARLNVITHLLRSLPYEDLTPEAIELPPRQKAGKYARPPMDSQKWLPRIYPGALVREPSEGADENAGASEAAMPTITPPVKPESGKKGKRRGKKKK